MDVRRRRRVTEAAGVVEGGENGWRPKTPQNWGSFRQNPTASIYLILLISVSSSLQSGLDPYFIKDEPDWSLMFVVNYNRPSCVYI